ncbi:hypothetical protein DPMN_038599 [Dreissena polymorpha]|uniref:Uncharacterized protein n=1 Tax=Dreissena polymorpha TaxID=45954 RepID=A0A9D4MHD7_DREPO|nr:hypothetical protein DPMN_038599 [Dreissena polymorpha]
MSANINNVFTDKETSNWFKASIALIVTKQGLEKFVDTEVQKVHAAVVASCGQCYTENLLPCPQGKWKCQNTKPCKFHKLPAFKHRPCPVGVCDKVKKNIESYHRYSLPSWKNTRAKLWGTSHWEVAKCFLPPDGYIDVSSVQDTDFNGVISVLLNCKHFDMFFSFPIAASPQCILTQVLINYLF